MEITNNFTTDVTMALEAFNTTVPCMTFDFAVKRYFTFKSRYLARVVGTSILFFLSLTGNLFVIWALIGITRRHLIMFNLALSNLAFSVFVMPLDVFWRVTMHWIGGDFLCKLCQMFKQFGMYASSFMVVVIAVDRVTAILCPTTPTESHRKMGITMIVLAWSSSFICSISAAVVFSSTRVPTCEGAELYQCIDRYFLNDKENQAFYYMFTMLLSFVFPLVATLVTFSLILCEISKMKSRDQALMGRRHSIHASTMDKAKKRASMMRGAVTLSFIICWGPYYAKGLYDWFFDVDKVPPAVSEVMYMMMYLNPVLQPLVFGIFMKDVRKKFHSVTSRFRNFFTERNSIGCEVQILKKRQIPANNTVNAISKCLNIKLPHQEHQFNTSYV